jgi:superfamily II DNA or RNA helicase
MFDEGHYEPAAVWSQAVRGFSCARIVFTATPFRNDFKLFDVDPKHVYRYSFAQACGERYIRSVKVHARKPIRSPSEFVEEVVQQYDELLGSDTEADQRSPRAIIRCDRVDQIRQLADALRQRGRSVVAIHETFKDHEAPGEYRTVPNPKNVTA